MHTGKRNTPYEFFKWSLKDTIWLLLIAAVPTVLRRGLRPMPGVIRSPLLRLKFTCEKRCLTNSTVFTYVHNKPLLPVPTFFLSGQRAM